MTETEPSREPDPFAGDSEALRRRQRITLLLILGQAILIFGGFLIAGPDYRPVVLAMTLPMVAALYTGARMLIKPPPIARALPEHRVDAVLSHRGVDVATLLPDASPAEVRLAVQDALDSLRRGGVSPRIRFLGRAAFWVGTLGWAAGAVGTWVLAHDAVGAVVCSIMAVGFGAVGAFGSRQAARRRAAEALLETQLKALGLSPVPMETDDGAPRRIHG